MPQNSGNKLQKNENHPPQEPPSQSQIPDILIDDSTPPVPETTLHESPVLPKPKVTKPVEKITKEDKIMHFFKKILK